MLVVVTCVGLVGLQLQHARAAARLGHAARRRARVRPPLGRVRPRRVRRRDRHRVVQARHLPGVRPRHARVQRPPARPRARPRGPARRASSSSASAPRSRSSPPTRTRSCSSPRPTTSAAGSSRSTSSRSSASRRSARSSPAGSSRSAAPSSRSSSAGTRRPRGDRVRDRRTAETRRRPSNEGAPPDGDPADIECARRCDEEEVDDDLREPRLQLRQQQPDGRTPSHCPQAPRTPDASRRARSARRTPAA